MVRGRLFLICVAALLGGNASSQPTAPWSAAAMATDRAAHNQANNSPANGDQAKAGSAATDSSKKDDPQKKDSADALKELFAAKIKVEWEALKTKDKKAYGDLLADDYQGVETDGQGERNKLQAIAEVSATNVANYTLWGLKVTPLDPNATFIVYEVTIQFPPGSVLHFSRLYIGALWVKQAGEWKELHYQETHVK